MGNPEFKHFIHSVIIRARSKISALLVALAYLDRTKSHLDPRLFGTRRVQERIFIAALILATKVRSRYGQNDPELTPLQYVDDSSPRGRRWSNISQIFTAREVGKAELVLLRALEWDLSITDDEVLRSWTAIVRRTTE